ncbi:hypothetical protein DOTSEDRAFT_24025 [Dothistroma septosporum NZE10]|uniref:C2H2-type domain-containing protein n=1 Tax=Dothistroma septosporum (strain NZE10 / CBS 128990) TaxID=675120 RepID=N1PK68_DOTSN|nr:hypothetical protein DOTSEDRAFT_24025 [Dothistroma septosporum NZE10]
MGNHLSSALEARSQYIEDEGLLQRYYQRLKGICPELGDEWMFRRRAESHAFNNVTTVTLNEAWTNREERSRLASLLALSFMFRFTPSLTGGKRESPQLKGLLVNYFDHLLMSPARRPPGISGYVGHVDIDEYGRGPRIRSACASLPSQSRLRYECDGYFGPGWEQEKCGRRFETYDLLQKHVQLTHRWPAADTGI